MSSAALQRQAALAGAALLAALARRSSLGRSRPAPTAVGTPPPVTAAELGGAPTVGSAAARDSAEGVCGTLLARGSWASLIRVLPCGVKLVVSVERADDVALRSIERGTVWPDGPRFRAHHGARRATFGFRAATEIRWRFAG